jgi:hypothetical protein
MLKLGRGRPSFARSFGGQAPRAHGASEGVGVCPRCYMLHATKWLFLGNSRILAATMARPRCYMLQKWVTSLQSRCVTTGAGEQVRSEARGVRKEIEGFGGEGIDKIMKDKTMDHRSHGWHGCRVRIIATPDARCKCSFCFALTSEISNAFLNL